MTNTLTISIDQLRLTLGSFTLGPITAQLHSGYPSVLLGSNGAGKSTLMKLLSHQVEPESGRAEISTPEEATPDLQDSGDSHSPRSSSPRVERSLQPQSQDFYGWSTCHDLVSYAAWVKGLSDREAAREADRCLSLVNLQDRSQHQARKLSGGMKRRLSIAQAITCSPRLLLLDEPTAGLDPGQRQGIHQIILELAKSSIVLVSTHLMEDSQALGHTIMHLQQGNLAGTYTELDTMEQRIDVGQRIIAQMVAEGPR